VISVIEDILSLLMSLVAILIPALAFLLVIVLAFLLFRLVRGILQRRREAVERITTK
jgi:Flp pilus assembly protein TadB